ncbi:7260_t:CDS:2, partial [Scutellospora calospora]
KIIEHPIINTLKSNLNIFDEYAIENFHSLLQRYTTSKVIFQYDYPYTKKDLNNLVKLSAICLIDFFNNLQQNPDKTELKKEGKKIKKDYYYFSDIQSEFSFKALPLRYHSRYYFKMNSLYDYLECSDLLENKGLVLRCEHGYHNRCFQILGYYCHYCFEYLSNSIEELLHLYNERIRMNESSNDWENSKDQSKKLEFDESENIEPVKACVDIDEKLKKKLQ